MTSKIKVDNINKVSDDSNIINKCGTTITLGASGDSIALASGASQTGFGRTGTVDWQTGSIKTATFTAANGEGYFCNTAGGTFEVDLPAGSAGAIVSVQDYNNTFDSNALTVDPNGSEKINGGDAGEPVELDTEGRGVTFVYIDATVGWRSVQDNDFIKKGDSSQFVTATVSGSCNTLTTVDTNFKVAIFKGPGTFCVSNAGNACGSNTVDYLVVAGGGSGGKGCSAGGGGGGAGGLRVSPGTASGSWTASPLGASPAVALPVSVQGYTIAVGGGGPSTTGAGDNGNSGSISTFSTISSAGGGGGSGHNCAAENGGSGGGGNPIQGPVRPAGTGNTPPVSPPQGNPGGTGDCTSSAGYPSAGGGGAIAAGQNGLSPTSNNGAVGGAGAQVNICGNNYFWAGGGGGSAWTGYDGGAGGSGGGGGAGGRNAGGAGSTTGINNGANGSGPSAMNGGAGGANTGGGGGGANNPGTSGNGGSGIVMIRYKFQ